MTHLRIELNTTPEIVTSDVIHKLYETAKAVIDAEEANEVEESLVSLKGNLLVSKAYGDEIDWLEAKFSDLHITAGLRYIRFADPEVERICVNVLNWGDGTGCTADDLYAINTVSGSVFGENTSITTFNELQYFKPTAFNKANLFKGCSSLTEVTLPSGITAIGQDMFTNCSNLTTIRNTESVTSIQGLGSCSKLVSINTPNLTSVGNYGCSGCTLLSTIDTSNVTSIGRNAFLNCTSLTSVDLSSCTSILLSAFLGCTGLTSADLSSCTSIGNSAFEGCTGLASIIDLSNCTTIGRGTFSDCSNLDITNWDLSNITKIGTRCFYGCSKLKGALNLSGVTTFDGVVLELFSGCSGLLKIVIGHLPLSLGSSRANFNRSPFYNCTLLKVVDINQLDGLQFCNNPIFKNTPAFEALIIRNTSLIPAIDYDEFTSQALWSAFAESSTPKIYVDDNLYSTYINHSDWSDLASHIDIISNYVES